MKCSENGSEKGGWRAGGLVLVLALLPAAAWAAEDARPQGGRGEDLGQRMHEGMHRTLETLGTTRAPKDTEGKIASATAAGPEAITRDATVMDFPAAPGGKPAVLRQGRNGWTCFPDNPGTPGKDPMCHDREWMKWMQAYLSKSKPSITTVGISYMLQGGSDASNTDPFAQKAPDSQGWMQVGPHIMVISPRPWDRNMYPEAMGEGRGPWIMFPGTPYEHLMVPVDK